MAELVALAAHGKPVEDMECMCCMDDIDETNYVEYRTGEGVCDNLLRLYFSGCV